MKEDIYEANCTCKRIKWIYKPQHEMKTFQNDICKIDFGWFDRYLEYVVW